MPRNLKSKRIVIKIGTNTLTDKNGLLELDVIRKLVSQIARIKNNKDIVIVTSGAIGAGMKELGIRERPKEVVGQQVCAAVGQGILMANYHTMFSKHKVKIAQILITYNDLANKENYRHLANSLERLFQLGIIPIINENDPVSISEIGPSFGDNDNMSALIAGKIKADLLIILTNVDGLFDKPPKYKDAVLISEVKNINKKIEAMGSRPSNLGIGGMKAKIQAAKKATGDGAAAIIANGRKGNVLIDIINGKSIGTIFYPKK
ncbi:glutamate 5-kinase [Candidatus Woesearchaeota archaeon]|nr:glutamate 5-kinase [Candidatus Woesearchaeota archaeon]